MADNDGSCLPQVLTDFVFDLCDSVTMSQISEEQKKLYSVTFRELSAKYYASTPWPTPQAIAAEANGHPLFLAVYREIIHRHWHSVRHPNVRDRVEGWSVYQNLWDEILDEDNITSPSPAFFLLPEWTFDIVHEFVYQFQGFCQYKGSLRTAAAKHGIELPITPGEKPANAPNHLIDNLNVLSQNKDAWATEQVYGYLHRLISVGRSSKVPGYQYLAIFASIALSRLECLMGDYSGCLTAADPVMSGDIAVSYEGETQDSTEIVHSVFQSRLSWAYHAGISFMMLRRYKDAIKTIGDICSLMQRGFKTGQLRKLPGSEQFNKLYDRMVTLLAILTHICPSAGLVEDPILRVIRDNHGSDLTKIDVGEKGFDDLFMFACPKFISPFSKDDAYKLQIRQFKKEMKSQQASRKLRSYMKLYASLEASKLAAFNDLSEDDLISLLVSYKQKMHQQEQDGTVKSAMDIHYHLSDDMVYIDEAEKQRRFENYFMAQIAQNTEIRKDILGVSTDV